MAKKSTIAKGVATVKQAVKTAAAKVLGSSTKKTTKSKSSAKKTTAKKGAAKKSPAKKSAR